MTQICWWLADVLSRFLEPDERDAVRGDLAESGETGWQALRGLLGLVVRRQAALWSDWRPWVALVGLAVPIGALEAPSGPNTLMGCRDRDCAGARLALVARSGRLENGLALARPVLAGCVHGCKRHVALARKGCFAVTEKVGREMFHLSRFSYFMAYRGINELAELSGWHDLTHEGDIHMEVMLAWFNVLDLAKAKEFYGNVLGLKKTFEMDGWAEFSHAQDAAPIGLMQDKNAAPVDGGAVVALKVKDLAQARSELSRKGVKLEGDVEEIHGMVKLQMFRDPFGNRLQLVQVMMQQQSAS